ncbi:hypothetical protein EI168_07130 [Halomonas sp. FME1]|uniref:DUF7281 domain-containing protein n=1 Tax=Halomonas casei TaxID=2742613 RepID=A0ABR9F094_9GAMM|nr:MULTISPECIES: hypothetical protein [Halomonas]MBE0399886.1 hypothetical protein [Halomonas casei]PCC23561.1 hypothetical protein CIK78_16720 [Halomonas sp. JB37]
MNLPSRARTGLNEVARLLCQQPTVVRPRRQWVDDMVAWCHQHDIDLAARLSGKTLRFDAALLAQINGVLESAKIAPLGRSLSGLASGAQAKEGVEEDKTNRESPRARRVLISLPPEASPLFVHGLAQPPSTIRDVDIQTLKLSAFSALIQVENLDSFYAFTADSPVLSDYVNPLIVYRGDSHYGGGFALLADAWHKTGRPHIYAGDFDVKGVTLALDSNATHLLLPDIKWLTQHATPLHVPAEQFSYQRRLRKHLAALPSAHPLREYLTLMLEKQRGLKQQWFGGEMWCVALC